MTTVSAADDDTTEEDPAENEVVDDSLDEGDADDDEEVVDAASDDEDEDEDEDEDDHTELTYEASEWSGQSRALLGSLLTSSGINHLWQGTTLVVERSDEAAVDALIDEVHASATAALDADAAKIVYEVGEWSAAMQTSLADTLAVADIPYEWDERGDLVVYESDEERVEAILDAMPDPDDEDRLGDDGLHVQAVLGALWQATKKLAKDPADSGAVVAVAEMAENLEHMAVPFGFEVTTWRLIVERAGALRDLLDAADGDEVDDEELIERSAELRDRLRPLV